MVVAGGVLAASAVTARGTDLRAERAQSLKDLVLVQAGDVRQREDSVSELRAEIEQLAREFSTPALRKLRAQIADARPIAGLTEQVGPGIIVTLNDAPRPEGGHIDDSIDPNWLLVHQEDIQGVVNALWGGGATAISVMDQRIINTSAIKCVGSTVLVNGKVFSPPFVIAAIGKPSDLIASLDNDESFTYFKDIAATFGLEYSITTVSNLEVDEYTGLGAMQYAKRYNAK